MLALFQPVLHTEVERVTVQEAVDWSSLCTAHTSVASYISQLQKEVFTTPLVYQMAG